MQPQSTVPMVGNWYLISSRSNLALKIMQKLAIGENKTGQLVISGTSANQQWVTLCVDQTGQLLIDKLHPALKLCDASNRTVYSEGSTIAPGTILETPNNALYLSEAPREGRVNQRIRLDIKKPQPRQLRSAAPAAAAEVPSSKDSIGSFLKPSRPTPAPQVLPARKPKPSAATTNSKQTIVVQEPRKVAAIQKPSNPPPDAQASKPSQIRGTQNPKPRIQTATNRVVTAKPPLRTPARPAIDDDEARGWGAGRLLLFLSVAALVAAVWWYREFSNLAPAEVIELGPDFYSELIPGAPRSAQ